MRGLVLLLGMSGLLSMTLVRPAVGVLVYYWISFMSPQDEIWGIAHNLPWAFMAVGATLLGCVMAREPRKLPINGMSALIILFLVLSTIASIFALGPRGAVWPAWERVIKGYFFVLVVMALMTERRRIHALVWAIVISLGYYGVVGGVFAIVTRGADHVYGAPHSMIGDNNSLAAALLITLPLMNYLRLQSKHRAVRVALLLAMLLTLLSVLATYSRGALIALSVIALYFWLKSRRKIVSGVVVAAVLVAGLSFMPAKWVTRMETIKTYHKDSSAQERLTVWKEALGIAMARPFTGGGYKSTATPSVLHQFYPGAHQRAVHSIWFQVLSENGFPAFFVWLAMMGLGVINCRRIIRAARDRPDLAWGQDFARMAQVSILAFATAGSFLSLGYNELYFVILGLLAIIPSIMAQTSNSAVVAVNRGTIRSESYRSSWRARRGVAR